VVVLAGDLDQAGARVVVTHPAREVVDEDLGQARVDVLELARVVMRGLVQAGRGDHVDAGLTGELDERLRPAAHAERRPLHDGSAAKLGEGPELSASPFRVIDLLAREQRRAEEQMVVRVGHAELTWREVPEDAPDYHCRPTSRSSNRGDERCRTS
jgi:hypothetical protein